MLHLRNKNTEWTTHLWEMLRWNAKSKQRFLSLQCFITILFTVLSFLNAWLEFCPLYSKVWIVVEQLLYLISFGLHLKDTSWLSKLCGIMGADIGFIWTCLLADAVEKLNGTKCLLSGEVKHVLWFKERLLRGTLARRCLGDMAVTLGLDSLLFL